MFTPSGVITLTTDFGAEGPFVATMKGRILTRFPAARIIDVTHDILVHWPAEAGFWLSRSWQYFPSGSVHVAVVDPGVGTRRDIIVVSAPEHVFVAPDNGLLAPIIGRVPGVTIHRLAPAGLERLAVGRPSATFHGRDIFAPIAAELAAGRCQPADLGSQTREFVPAWVDEPELIGQAIRGAVMTLDHFGNLVTNIDQELLRRFTRPVVHAANQRFPLRHTYGDVRPGEYLALINSFGVVEIARAEQSAAEGLGLGRGAPVSVTEG
ncbi:MAG TPA: SAM-dependent chlorinase/fluorinase [Steroidobacteraceae bacterium]|nr:SAM-dependent chlorinase/fluorinase [Steroidobacteraceae bacterium]